MVYTGGTLLEVQGCGSGRNVYQKAKLSLDVGDFCICVNGCEYRFAVYHDGSIGIALINGVDARIRNVEGYSGIILTHGEERDRQ